MRRDSGFTLIELITIVVILGILAVVVVPRLGGAGYRDQELRDRSVSALRYAQKSAVSHRRTVCVTFGPASLSLQIDTDGAGACDTDLMLPGSSGNTVQSGNAAVAFFSPVPANFFFRADGSGAGATISIPGQPDIVVNGVTGYVE